MLIGGLRRLARRRRPRADDPGRSVRVLRDHAGARHRVRDRGRAPRCVVVPPARLAVASRVRADQIISGTIINIAAVRPDRLSEHDLSRARRQRARATSPRSCHRRRSSSSRSSAGCFNMFLNQGPIAMSRHRHRDRLPGLAVPVALGPAHAGRRRAPEGRRDRRHRRHPPALPERPAAAASSRASAGAYLSMEATNSFQAGMTGGRGFIGLAAMIVGRWTPIGAFGAALLFSSSLSRSARSSSSRRRAATSGRSCRRSRASSSTPCRTS